MLELKNISIAVGGRDLITEASVTIFAGDKIGIVGHNGCGKTTLLRAILGELEVGSGEIYVKKDTKIVCVKQEISDTTVKLLDFVISSDKRLIELRNQLNDHEENIAEIYEEINRIDGNSADARAAAILAGLGFGNDDLHKSLNTFSGGWQVRASLAATLFAPSDIIMLDEPTNHLDLEAVIWLESFLRTSNKALLLVSHERTFLDDVCNKILNIDAAQIKLYSGNYSTFVRTKAEQKQALIRMCKSQQRKREHIQDFVDRFRYKASKARQVQSRIKFLDKLEVIETPSEDYNVQFQFHEPFPGIDRRLITLDNISAGYNNDVVLKNVSLCFDSNERIAFLGANGNGKSTLAKVIAGRLIPFSGEIKRAHNLKIAYFSQQQTDELDVNLTATEMFRVHYSGSSETQIRSILAGFGLMQARSRTKIEQLSGGEKTRLLLAIIAAQCPHMLILDEPTNHLDIEAREALIDSLKQYKGTVVWISHDFHTLEASCDKFFIVRNGTCECFGGTLDDYKNVLLSVKDVVANKKEKNSSKVNRLDKKVLKKIAVLETKMSSFATQKNELENELNEKYSIAMYEQYTRLLEDLNTIEKEWFTLMESTEN